MRLCEHHLEAICSSLRELGLWDWVRDPTVAPNITIVHAASNQERLSSSDSLILLYDLIAHNVANSYGLNGIASPTCPICEHDISAWIPRLAMIVSDRIKDGIKVM